MSIVVKAGPNTSSDAVIRQFQKRVIMEKAIQEYRDRMYHKPNSLKRKERLAEKRRKINRTQKYS